MSKSIVLEPKNNKEPQLLQYTFDSKENMELSNKVLKEKSEYREILKKQRKYLYSD